MNIRFLKSSRSRAMTLVEIILAILIVAMVSTAAAYLLRASALEKQMVMNESSAMSQLELAWHRIQSNTRAVTVTPTVSTSSNGQSQLTITVPSIANSNTVTVVYSCTGTQAPYTLIENDSRFNSAGNTPQTLATNVSSFTVSLSTSPTTTVTLDLRLLPDTGAPTSYVERKTVIHCRNL